MTAKILVFIPAYCCESQIIRVINQFDDSVQDWVHTVLVIDNQSHDKTLDNAIETGKRVLKKSNFIAWRNDNNYGLGGSHKAAFRYAVEHDFEYLVVLHGDDQADIRDLIPHLESGSYREVDSLLGARFMKGSQLQGYSWFRTFGNYVYNVLFSIVVSQTIRDLGSGLNIYRIEAFRSFYYKPFPDDLTFNYVMLLASYHRQHSVRYFPISWREEDQLSNVKLFRQARKVMGLLADFGLNRGAFLNSEMREQAFEAYTGKIQYYQPSRYQGA